MTIEQYNELVSRIKALLYTVQKSDAETIELQIDALAAHVASLKPAE